MGASRFYYAGEKVQNAGTFLCLKCRKHIVQLAKSSEFPPCPICGGRTSYSRIGDYDVVTRAS